MTEFLGVIPWLCRQITVFWETVNIIRCMYNSVLWNSEMISVSCNIYIDGVGNSHIWLLSDSNINCVPLSGKFNLYVYILLASPWASERFIMTNVKMFVVMSYIILHVFCLCIVMSYRFRGMFFIYYAYNSMFMITAKPAD